MDGGGESSFFFFFFLRSFSGLACRGRAPRWPSVRYSHRRRRRRRRRLSNPRPITRQHFRLKKRIGGGGGRRSRGRVIGERRGKQAVHADIKCTSEGRQEEALSERCPSVSACRREVSARAGKSLGGEDELMHMGGRGESPLPPLDST